ncbi:hypothetical protein P0F65_22510 [Sphingomonas sp. I4]
MTGILMASAPSGISTKNWWKPEWPVWSGSRCKQSFVQPRAIGSYANDKITRLDEPDLLPLPSRAE